MEKLQLSQAKYNHLVRLSNAEKVIAALAIDQRGALKRLLSAAADANFGDEILVDFKKVISSDLTQYASSILLDAEYGVPAAELRHRDCGFIAAYEKTGYDASTPGRLPDLLPNWSAKRIKELGADAVKILLYYDVDDKSEINDMKHAWVERIGSECIAEDIPYFVEILTYDASDMDVTSREYAALKPHKVNGAMREFSKPRYHADVLKVEVPVNMNFVEGYTDQEPVYSLEEAKSYFKEQAEATHLPFIFLSAGVSAKLFQETLVVAKEAGSSFNGVLCGRATWKDAVAIFAKEGEAAAKAWLANQGRKNMEELNSVLATTASSWLDKVEVQ
ncbi:MULTISPECIES: tagatose-bisphosphate aldolase [unclassified Streptococcus]|uniref:tagatose-bisphosphate aldolase n=1 Tax=unclassified Streptococcus TaxID=2608887 RepID=UPI001072D090|nr:MULTISPECIES: tagatose-bisphosphate aldolase [unclassified Streptococcus]MBF0788130.1 tagatose-bisphosphate aldolase [Streptococcus sp. 19428wC2_LYSM12]MCQ9211268.1 tagatose-bisphosphate aldolase [Streptococcus sp. B01]MCQ9214581.1 tagatose-bisphosphate aldolase [Streptococcus sp. O1]TFV04803.1 tagatose-bisphosphate aldolase [Streptococcus sp. LYSM12]